MTTVPPRAQVIISTKKAFIEDAADSKISMDQIGQYSEQTRRRMSSHTNRSRSNSPSTIFEAS